MSNGGRTTAIVEYLKATIETTGWVEMGCYPGMRKSYFLSLNAAGIHADQKLSITYMRECICA